MLSRAHKAPSKGLNWDKKRTAELFVRYRDTNDREAREELAETYASLVRYLASKFRNRGEPFDDLVQVGMIGLLKAIERFDLDRNLEFTTYATPTILGEIKRHFRDRGWAIKVPRRMQELSAQVNKAVEILSLRDQTSPTIPDIAKYLEVTEDEVIDALDASEAYATTSYDAVDTGHDEQLSILEYCGKEDADIYHIEDRELLEDALAQLDDTARTIIRLRFFEERSQTDIAKTLGISQMQVSRILRRSLGSMRQHLSDW